MKRQVTLLIFVIMATILTLSVKFFDVKAIVSLENIIKDSMFILRGEIKSDNRIIIIDIDEKSLKELGQWPWSRNKVAKVLENLTRANVSSMGLDIIFAEEDNSSPKKVLKDLDIDSLENPPDYDEIFAQTLKNTPTVTGFIFSMKNDGVDAVREPRSKAIIIEKNKKTKIEFLPTAYRAVLNIEKLENSSFSSGYLNNLPEYDGVVRSVPSAIMYDGILYPPLSIELLRLTLGIRKIIIQYDENGVLYVKLGDYIIPTDKYGNIRVNFTGHYPKYKYISASDIYYNKFDKKDIEGKIALLGTSTAGLFDLRSSPFDVQLPGVEVHANLMDNILNKNMISQANWSLSIDLILIIFLAIICYLLLLINKISISFISAIGLICSIFFIHYYVMFHEGLIFNSIVPILEIILIFFIGIGINYKYETKHKEFIKSKFANKVSTEVMEEIIKERDTQTLDASSKEISIFFSDIRSFTTISENMHSAEKLVNLLNRYMTPMVDIIIQNKGTVDKFIGDAIMAYWNAPKQLEYHADYALRASIEQIESLKKLNIEFEKESLPAINIGIGLNVGECVVGEMGSFGRSDYTCIGDSVNLGSRLESLNKKYGTNIILSEFFLAKLKNPSIYNIVELGKEQVKGKSEVVTIYECKGYA